MSKKLPSSPMWDYWLVDKPTLPQVITEGMVGQPIYRPILTFYVTCPYCATRQKKRTVDEVGVTCERCGGPIDKIWGER